MLAMRWRWRWNTIWVFSSRKLSAETLLLRFIQWAINMYPTEEADKREYNVHHTHKRLSVSFHFRQGRHVEIPGSSNSKFWPQKWFCLTLLLRHCWTWEELGDQSVSVPGIRGFRGRLKSKTDPFFRQVDLRSMSRESVNCNFEQVLPIARFVSFSFCA